MRNKFSIALTCTLFSGAVLAVTDNLSGTSSSSTSSVIPFAELDANKDGGLTQNELQRIPEVAANFGQIDFNGDGKIIEPDYYALMSTLRTGKAPELPEYSTLDVNRDGTVEAAEYNAFKLTLTDLDKLIQSGALRMGAAQSGARDTQGASTPAAPPAAANPPPPTTP